MSNTFKQPQYRDATMTITNTFSKSTFKVVGDAQSIDALCIGLWGDSIGNNSYGYIQTIIDATTGTSQGYPLLLNPNGGNVSIGNTNPFANLHITGGVQANLIVNSATTPFNVPPVLLLDATNQSLGTTKGFCMPIFTSRSYVDNVSYLNIYTYRHSDGNTRTTASTRIQNTIDTTNMSYIEFDPPGANLGIGIYGNYSGNLNASSAGLTINQSGNVGFGTASPTVRLHVEQTGSSAGQSSAIITAPNGSVMPATNWPNGWSGGLRTFDINLMSIRVNGGTIYPSDARLKTNIETFKRSLSEIMELRPVSFVWKDLPNYGTHYGFIAQEFEKIIPEFVVEDANGFKSIKYGLNTILVNSIQENQKTIETLQLENQEIRNQVSSILSRLTQLEKQNV